MARLPKLGKGSEMDGLWISLLRNQTVEVEILSVSTDAEFPCWNPGQNWALGLWLCGGQV